MSGTRTADDGQRMFQLKLETPRLPSSVVHRARLMAVLKAVASNRLVRLTAPAGFGKSTLLSQWRDHLSNGGARVGWFTLDESDADVRRFVVGVMRSLMASGQIAGLGGTDHDLEQATIDSIVREMLAQLHAGEGPVTLILDDYHRASSPALDAFLARWIAALPDRVRLLMSSRRSPELQLHGFFGAGEAVELTSEMLRFTSSEARELLDLGLDEQDLNLLVERTEGWPVALQLARLVALHGKDQGLEHRVAFGPLAKRGGHLWKFLSDEVLRGLSEEAVGFLLDTSILERFSAEIADVMRGRDDSWRIMNELEPLQSLLTPVDADAIWFRYHHLFAEYLQAQLRQRHPSAVPALHLRASQAFEHIGLLEEAVRHASLAGDYARCADLVERAGGWRLVLIGGSSQLRQLLSFIPATERLLYPRLLLAEAYVKLKMGLPREARSTFDLVASATLQPTGDWSSLSDFERDILNVDLLIRVYEDDVVDAPLLAFSNGDPQRMAGADGLTIGGLQCAGAVASLATGDLTKAEDLARQAMSAMRSANSVLGLNYCFLHAGLACAYRGELRGAIAYLQRAESMAVENFGSDSGLKALAETLLATVQLWWTGQLTMTAEELEAAFRHVCDYDGWFEIHAAGLDSRFRLAWLKRDIADLDRVIADGEALVEARGTGRLSGMVEAQRLLRHHAAGDGPRTRSLAELLTNRFRQGAWRHQPTSWRPYQDVAFALGTVLARHARDDANGWARDMLACAQSVGSKPYEIRACLLLAHIAAMHGYHDEASVHLRAAVERGAGEGIALPFVEQHDLAPLIRQLKRELWEGGGNPVDASFLSDIDDRIAEIGPQEGGVIAALSAREQEVVGELSRGLTNKEIARVLDMTEHTVKFHLKNIFAKLGVDRRAHALSALRDKGWSANR